MSILVSAETSALIDKTAATEWGLNPFALVEAAGRNMADKLAAFLGPALGSAPIIAFIGSGSNGADAMVTLKTLILSRIVNPYDCRLVLNRIPLETEQTPRSEAFKTLVKMNVRHSDFMTWKTSPSDKNAGLVIDGVTGTGLKGQLTGTAAEMALEINEMKRKASVTVASVDVPSGLFDEWTPDMPIVNADVTLAVEPQKLCLYKPSARVFAGDVMSVGGVFPQELLDAFAARENAELFKWETVKTRIPKVAPDAHKYQRGLVEIHAGCVGSAGAARIASAGAQAVGAGLIRLLVDKTLYPILAGLANGAMVAPETDQVDRWKPDAALLGPGWGDAADRQMLFETTLARAAANDATIVLDADAIPLIKKTSSFTLHKTILTPHVGEFVKFACISKEAALSNPIPILKRVARETQTTILYKSHTLIVADTDGRIGIIDGMTPVLAAGGSGDLLAGVTAGLAARRVASPFICAVVAASLLVEAGKAMKAFVDPLELAGTVSRLAFEAWG
jgi:NAD(P)H-hydrate epimerase